MATMTSADIAAELQRFGIDPNATNNPMGKYGFSNTDYAAGVAMGFGEFSGDTASLAHGYDVLANRQTAPSRYRAASSSLADIITGKNQFDPFDDDRGSQGGIANRDLGMTTAINTMLGQPTGLEGAHADHFTGIQNAMMGVWGDGSKRGITGGADVFVGGPGSYVNADMSGRINKYGAQTAPGGVSRFFNYNAPTGANPWGFGPPLGSKTSLPGFGPAMPPRRPGEFSLGGNNEVYDNVNTEEGWMRHFTPNAPELQLNGKWYRDDTTGKDLRPINAEEEWLRINDPDNAWLQKGNVYNRTPGGEATLGDEEAWLRRYDPNNAWLQQGTGPYSRDASGAPTMSAKESWLRRWAPNNEALQPNGEFGVQLAKGGSNTGVGLIYDPSTGAYVPNTGGMGEEERWLRQYAPDAPDLQPGHKYGPPGPAPTPAPAQMTEAQWLQAYGAPTAADLNGFQSTQYQAPATPSFVDNSAPAAQYQAPTFGTPSFGSLPGGVYGAAPLGGGTPGVSTIPYGATNPFPADPNYNTNPVAGITIQMPNTTF